MMRSRILVLGLVGAAAAPLGCGNPQSAGQTAVTVHIALDGNSVPKAVDIHVFDPHGLVGQSHIQPAKMPGQLTISGLSNASATTLRIVAVGDASAGHLLGGARVDVFPDRTATASVTMSTTYSDADQDDVPDDLDGCPQTPDPLQENAAGVFPNDACRPDSGVVGGGNDLAVGSDAGGGASDMGGDMANPPPPPPDMATAGSNCANISVKLCDGFEGSTVSNVWDTTVHTNGTATIDTTRAYRGKSSLKLHNNALSNASADVELFETTTFPASHFYARAFAYVPSTFSLATAGIMFAEQNSTPYNGIALNLLNGSFQTDNTIGNVTKGSTTTMPTNQWVCLEWEVQAGSSGYTNLTVNGTAANGLTGTQNLGGSPSIAQFGLALIATGNVAARDLWLDELVVDSAPIGCTK
jgi:hypothetical protein